MLIKFSKVIRFLFLFLFFDLTCQLNTVKNNKDTLTPQVLTGIATKAYIYGYPLVLMDITKKVMTNVKSPEGIFAPVNQFGHTHKFIKAKYDKIQKLEPDVIYSSAWLDLENGPIVLHLPNFNERYYLIEVIDGWTNIISSIGKRKTGTLSQDYVFVGPDFKGELPKNIKAIKSTTNTVWLLGRIFSKNKDDYKEVINIQKQITLKPLSYLNKDYKPEENNNIDICLEMGISPTEQVENMEGVDFFSYLAKLLKKITLPVEDQIYFKKFDLIGLTQDKDFDVNNLSKNLQAALDSSPEIALKLIYGHGAAKNRITNGWSIIKGLKSYGTNYLKRAAVAYQNLGANLIEDEIYATLKIDSKGRPLEGRYNYIIHFEPNQVPRAKAFWSVTIYNEKLLFVDNPLNRYSLGDRSNLKYNLDGSLDIFVQKRPTDDRRKSNWLPAPSGDFELILRVYSPDKKMLNGLWVPPVVRREPDEPVLKAWYRKTFDIITEDAFE